MRSPMKYIVSVRLLALYGLSCWISLLVHYIKIFPMRLLSLLNKVHFLRYIIAYF